MPKNHEVGSDVVCLCYPGKRTEARKHYVLGQGHTLASRGHKQGFEARQHSRRFAVGDEAPARSLGPHRDNGR